LEIVVEQSGVFLYSSNESQSYYGDSWHFTIEDAKNQAAEQYGVRQDEWLPVGQ